MHKDFSDDAWADYTYWIMQDKKILKKINQLLADIERNGNDGIGHPEPLKGNLSGGVFLFGYLSEQDDILAFMRDEVSKDDNWRVQEILAKAFDEFCKKKGYEKALPIIDEWLRNNNANTRRAVTEGLRIWTSRPYFKDNPNEAIRRIASLKEDTSDYVRKSVGNALRDISKKFPELIEAELNNWNLESKEINQVYKLASKFIS